MSRGDAPAFPATNYVIPRDLEARHVSALGKTQGMTLRDYFAAHAPPAPKWWIDGYTKNATDLDTVAETIAQWNYVYADSMLAAGGEK